MRRPLIIATTAAGAALAAGLIAVPALADTLTTTSPPTSTSAGTRSDYGPGGGGMRYGRGGGTGLAGNGDGAGAGNGTGYGAGNGDGAGAGNGDGAGTGYGTGNGAGNGTGLGRSAQGTDVDPLAGLSQGTLTADQKSRLAGMAEEEKLAHDVYVVLAASTQDARFARIATAEARHLTEVRALLARYGIADPTAGNADGQFATGSVQELYTDLVARGSASLDAALAVGRDIENLDLKDLSTAGSGVTAQDVNTVYSRLANGSRMHLRTFGG